VSGLPALAGGSPELDADAEPLGVDPSVTAGAPVQPLAPETTRPQPEVVFVAVLAGAVTLFFGIIPEPLFNLVTHAGGALSGLF
jgi:hypothetical protein